MVNIIYNNVALISYIETRCYNFDIKVKHDLKTI